jgi:rhamnogalacturonyl hydrolase YesR
MFVYTLSKGVHRGWLDRKDTAVTEKTAQGLATRFVTYDATGLLRLGGTADAVGLGGPPPIATAALPTISASNNSPTTPAALEPSSSP